VILGEQLEQVGEVVRRRTLQNSEKGPRQAKLQSGEIVKSSR
jgi:hypothetical protein